MALFETENKQKRFKVGPPASIIFKKRKPHERGSRVKSTLEKRISYTL